MVTIKEIAQSCNLSAAAVSKALREQPDISQVTREKVKKVAKEMGYIPNAAAIRLKTNHSYTIGVLLKNDSDSRLDHAFFASVLNHFIFACHNSGYTVLFLCEKIGHQDLSYLESAQTFGCDAVFILNANYQESSVIQLMEGQIPLVLLDYSFHQLASVHSDNAVGMGEMVRYAYEKGHRKIAMIYGDDSFITKQRVASFHKACHEVGLEIPDEYISQQKYHAPETAERATHLLLDLPNPPTFIFYQDDFSFLGGKTALEERGLSYPKDISVAGYDGQPISQGLSPKLMTWKQNTVDLGKKAWEILQEAIEHPKTYLPKDYQVQGEFCSGASVKDLTVG
ncbi:MAG: LacI family DNA-binding transcriptional regulator [Eubacteriales bacterium]